jgi:hypothetical protein
VPVQLLCCLELAHSLGYDMHGEHEAKLRKDMSNQCLFYCWSAFCRFSSKRIASSNLLLACNRHAELVVYSRHNYLIAKCILVYILGMGHLQKQICKVFVNLI